MKIVKLFLTHKMQLLYSLATIYVIINQISCAQLNPTNEFYSQKSKKTNSENVEIEQKNIDNISHESSGGFELFLKNFCRDELYQHKFISYDNKPQTLWVTWNLTKAGERAILPNICSIDNGLPLRRRCHRFANNAKWDIHSNQTVLIDCRTSMFCEQDIFDHYIVDNSGELKLKHNIWKRTKIGEYSSLQELCLQPNGLHLTRKCYYDKKNHRARWASAEHLKDIKCLQNIRQHIISNQLNQIYDNVTMSNWLIKNTTTCRQTATTLLAFWNKPEVRILPADVQLTSHILKSIVADSQDIELSRNVLKITHNLMSTNPKVLQISAELNATNILLETFENYMDGLSEKLVPKTKCHISMPTDTGLAMNGANDSLVDVLNLEHIGVVAYSSSNISVFFVNPACALISGIAVYTSNQQNNDLTQTQEKYKQKRYDSINNFYYRFVFMNESIKDLLYEDHLELASFIPSDIWTSLQQTFYDSVVDTPVIVFKIYDHDGLFVERNVLRTRRPFSKILSISLPGLNDKLPEAVPFILRRKSFDNNSKSSPNTGCGYWNYSTWISSGVHMNSSQHSEASDLILCFTNHLTQFSYLLGGSYRQDDLSHEVLVTTMHQEALDIISLVGCTLSLLGLLGIWLTALLFKNWRSQASNKVLLNLCVALTLQMLLFLFVNTDDTSEALVEKHSYTNCVILGALLQYSILVLFTWMLIVALLQFQRYVTVIGIQRPKHYILKSALLAWGLPLVPTLLVALLDSSSYIPSSFQLATDTGICYPSGKGLHYGVILPVSLIVLANLLIFLYVFYSISHTLSMTIQRYEKRMVFKQIRLSILLFFLLGLSWIFGILVFIKAETIFSYLFCLTATLQGFVLFIYFVVIDDNARNSWRKLLCPKCIKKKKATDVQSMTTFTASLTHDVSSSRDR